ncbi:MAG: helix-turn-helix transcriptional regulator [Clostridia bacterium]|nr:helix-turn-helix transcriptional regulator [Clostridia bacterium]
MHDHHALLDHVMKEMPDDSTLDNLTRLFKVFGDRTRMRILYALSLEEMCVCAISEYLKIEQTAISHQLRVLRESRLIKSRREGKTVYYSLDDSHVHSIISEGYEHITEVH